MGAVIGLFLSYDGHRHSVSISRLLSLRSIVFFVGGGGACFICVDLLYSQKLITLEGKETKLSGKGQEMYCKMVMSLQSLGKMILNIVFFASGYLISFK